MSIQKKIVLAAPFNSTWAAPIQKALQSLGFTVILFDYRNIFGCLRFNLILYIYLLGRVTFTAIIQKPFSRYEILNLLLIELCKKIKPEYVFVIKGETLTKKTIEAINRNKCTTILWQIDPLSHPSIWNYATKVGKSYQIYVSCEPGRVVKKLRSSGFKNVLYMLGAADGTNMQYLQHTPKKYDVVLIGTFDPVREKYLKALKGLDVHIWGWGDWQHSAVAEMFEGRSVTQKELLAIYSQAKIVINIGRAKKSTIPTNLRPFEAAQVGAFILVDYTPNLEEVFKIKKEIDYFKSPSELNKKAEYYLQHTEKRIRMAQALYKRVCRDHTYQMRLKKLFEEIKLLGY